MATLGGDHRTRTLWQPLGAVTGTRQIARGDLHNLIGDSDACLELYTTMIELRTPHYKKIHFRDDNFLVMSWNTSTTSQV